MPEVLIDAEEFLLGSALASGRYSVRLARSHRGWRLDLNLKWPGRRAGAIRDGAGRGAVGRGEAGQAACSQGVGWRRIPPARRKGPGDGSGGR